MVCSGLVIYDLLGLNCSLCVIAYFMGRLPLAIKSFVGIYLCSKPPDHNLQPTRDAVRHGSNKPDVSINFAPESLPGLVDSRDKSGRPPEGTPAVEKRPEWSRRLREGMPKDLDEVLGRAGKRGPCRTDRVKATGEKTPDPAGRWTPRKPSTGQMRACFLPERPFNFQPQLKIHSSTSSPLPFPQSSSGRSIQGKTPRVKRQGGVCRDEWKGGAKGRSIRGWGRRNRVT